MDPTITTNGKCQIVTYQDMFYQYRDLQYYYANFRERRNQLIHLIFVPTIWATTAVWLCYTGPLVDYTLGDLIGAEKLSLLPSFVSQNCVLNAALVLFLAYALLYIFLDLTGGVRV